MAIIATIFALYLGLMVLIGIKHFKETKDVSDYVLGGRSLNSWMTAMSAQASDMSGWLLIGLPGAAYAIYTGTIEAIWTAIGLWLGTYLNWLFVAKRLRKYTAVASDSITLPDFFENRFRDSKHLLKLIAGVFTVIFFLVYTASQFAAGGKLFNTIFGVNYVIGLFIIAGIILAYTALGGFNAVCSTDTIMGITMFFAMIIVPIVGLVSMGGLEGTAERLATLTTESLGLFPEVNGHINTLLIASSLGWGLGYFGQPHILVRFMAIESPDSIKKSRRIAMIWVTITLVTAIAVGVIGKAMYPNLADGETVFMNMINDMFNPVVAGLLMTAILGAIMSTASSQLLVASSSVASDIYQTFLRKNADDKEMVWVNRVATIMITVIAIVLALDPNSSVFGLVASAWGGFGSVFGPLILFALFYRKMTRQAAIGGMIIGGVIDIIWFLKDGGIFDIYEIIPGFIAASVVIIVVSNVTKPSSDMLEEFDKVKEYTI
ncbi:MAG: sodium/proline symporter PutP [Anaerovoracaceae bacterium]